MYFEQAIHGNTIFTHFYLIYVNYMYEHNYKQETEKKRIILLL